jgi:hypothetical protein
MASTERHAALPCPPPAGAALPQPMSRVRGGLGAARGFEGFGAAPRTSPALGGGDRRAERGVRLTQTGDAHVGSEDRTEDTSILDSFEIVEIPATLPIAHPPCPLGRHRAPSHSLMCSAPMLGSLCTVGPYLDARVHCDHCAVTAHVCQSIMAAEPATRTRHIPIVTVSQRCRPSLSRLPVVPL